MLNNQNVTLSDGRKVLVKELRIKDLLDALKRFESDDSDLKGGLLELLPQLCDLPESALVELYPSDLEKLVAAFKKANSFFSSWRGRSVSTRSQEICWPGSGRS